MKKLLLLVPLLAACAPMYSGTNNPTPFKSGQTWKVSSHSALDTKLPESTQFNIVDVNPSGKNEWEIDGRYLGTDVYILYLAGDDKVAVLLERSYNNEDSRIRFCGIDMTEEGVHQGYASHISPIALLTYKASKIRAQVIKALADADEDASEKDLRALTLQAVVKSVDDSDIAPCTLERVQ